RGDKAVVNRVFDNGAARSRTLLTSGEESGVDDILHRGGEVGVGEHDGGVLTAHFELDPQATLGGTLVEPRADLARPGEGDSFEGLGVYQRLAERPTGAGDEVDDAFGRAGFVEGFDDAPSAQRSGGSRLEHHRVAANQRRREFPGRDGAGKVP